MQSFVLFIWKVFKTIKKIVELVFYWTCNFFRKICGFDSLPKYSSKDIWKPEDANLPFRKFLELVVYTLAGYVATDDAVNSYNLFGMDIDDTNLMKVSNLKVIFMDILKCKSTQKYF